MTLKYSPADGFVRLDLHLARLARSAAALGWKFDIERAREALDFSVKDCADALRIRLTLNESGEFACTSAPLAPDATQWTYAISPLRISSTDTLARHKTNWRDLYDSEHARLTKSLGCNEVIFLNAAKWRKAAAPTSSLRAMENFSRRR